LCRVAVGRCPLDARVPEGTSIDRYGSRGPPAHAEPHHLNTSVLEGINNRIKVIKRMVYGYRDSACFFLEIKAAVPGKAR
jgi:hypothetical protein